MSRVPSLSSPFLLGFDEIERVQLAGVIRDSGLSGAIYTQTTDVENEVNGFLTYDRRVLKPELSVVAEHNRAVIAAGRVVSG